MQIIVKIINGSEHTLEVLPEQSILDLKELLFNQISIPVNQQRIMFKGKSLADQNILTDYSIVEGTKIHLSIKKDVETDLTKELKVLGKSYVTDVDQFAIVFNQELKKLVNEMSLDDIERYEEARLKLNEATMQSS